MYLSCRVAGSRSINFPCSHCPKMWDCKKKLLHHYTTCTPHPQSCIKMVTVASVKTSSLIRFSRLESYQKKIRGICLRHGDTVVIGNMLPLTRDVSSQSFHVQVGEMAFGSNGIAMPPTTFLQRTQGPLTFPPCHRGLFFAHDSSPTW